MTIFLSGTNGLYRTGPGAPPPAPWARRCCLGPLAPPGTSHSWGEDVSLLSIEAGDQELADGLSQFEAVINLAGEPLFGKRRTPSRKRAIVESRVPLASRLVGAMRRAERPPKILISGSTGDYDGDQAAERLNEQDAPHTGFLAQLCCDWEHAAMVTVTAGARGDWVRQPAAHCRELLPEEAAFLHFGGGAQRPERTC